MKNESSSRHTDRGDISQPKLWIILEGPFVIVLGPPDGYAIHVFVPMDKCKEHVFLINGDRRTPGRRHKVALEFEPGTLQINNTPPDTCDSCLTKFLWTSSDWAEKNHKNLVEIDNLPLPDRIFCTDRAAHVIFESGDPAEMASGHVLEYTVLKPDNIITMIDKPRKTIYALPDPPDPSIEWFSLQIGLPVSSGDPDPGGTHAIDFHNNSMLPRFPSIAKNTEYRLKSVDQLTRAPWRLHDRKVHPLTTAVECKSGGFIVTT